MLMVQDPPEVLERLFPEDEDKERLKRHAERMRKAKRIRLESDNGTAVWFDMRGQPVSEQWGWTESPAAGTTGPAPSNTPHRKNASAKA